MANPRQRRKARSGTHSAVSHTRHAKRNIKKMPPVRGPSTILSSLWDKRKTVRQNYAALGLMHTLNPSAAGGIEPVETKLTPEEEASTPNFTAPMRSGHGRIVRDGEGNVVRIELAEEDEEMAEVAERDKTMESLGAEIDANVRQKWITGLGGGRNGKADGRAVEALERVASGPFVGAGPRMASRLEAAYLQRLVAKHGTDVQKMARDRKLNAEQRTVGELTRGLRRCGLGGGD
ncbi:ribosome biogenesis protein Nop16, partial [Mycena pura]